VNTSHVLSALAEHLNGFELNDPVHVAVRAGAVGPHATIQLSGESLALLAAELLAWADTLDNVTVTAWRPCSPDDDQLHLEVRGRLTDETPVKVFGGLLGPPRLPLLAGGEDTAIAWALMREWADLAEAVAA
jgi:hypothetical protein